MSIVAMADEIDPVFKWAKSKLQDMQYHNLGRVDHYYRGALGISIFPNEETKRILMSFIPIRHDCVHRNGRDKDGNARRLYGSEVAKLAKAIDAVVKHIEEAHSIFEAGVEMKKREAQLDKAFNF